MTSSKARYPLQRPCNLYWLTLSTPTWYYFFLNISKICLYLNNTTNQLIRKFKHLKNLFRTVVLKILESPLDSKGVKPTNPKGNQPWIFIARTDDEAEATILWPPDVKSWLTGKDPDVGKEWGQEEKGTTEDEMARWHHRLDEHEFEWTLGVGDGQEGLVCCDSWGRKESDTTEWLNWTELSWAEVYGNLLQQQ